LKTVTLPARPKSAEADEGGSCDEGAVSVIISLNKILLRLYSLSLLVGHFLLRGQKKMAEKPFEALRPSGPNGKSRGTVQAWLFYFLHRGAFEQEHFRAKKRMN